VAGIQRHGSYDVPSIGEIFHMIDRSGPPPDRHLGAAAAGMASGRVKSARSLVLIGPFAGEDQSIMQFSRDDEQLRRVNV
jgi:hypothetical protein